MTTRNRRNRRGRRKKWLLPAALTIATLLIITSILYFLQDHYRTSHLSQNRLIVCGSTESLGPNGGVLTGCRAVPCIEVLPSGEMATLYFAYC